MQHNTIDFKGQTTSYFYIGDVEKVLSAIVVCFPSPPQFIYRDKLKTAF